MLCFFKSFKLKFSPSLNIAAKKEKFRNTFYSFTQLHKQKEKGKSFAALKTKLSDSFLQLIAVHFPQIQINDFVSRYLVENKSMYFNLRISKLFSMLTK